MTTPTKTVPMSTFTEAAEAFQRDFLIAALERNGWKVAATAREVDLERKQVYRLMKKLKISPPAKAPKPTRVKRRYHRSRLGKPGRRSSTVTKVV